ncbi:hypothetical protein F7725_020366 [Dissostichus mawsoni]|uniref:Exoribonuclease phosphorolytic domain-containing protein n=1 Tax=Dissostichus mawsoni TaxID=36200 RepID=A0A7J5YGE7_DISMA|nr:hypothetical protein F7725_020366 [Dissostichus mawsoni]
MMEVCGSMNVSLREFGCEQTLLSRPDGSASFVQVSKEIYDRATLEVLIQPKVGLPRAIPGAVCERDLRGVSAPDPPPPLLPHPAPGLLPERSLHGPDGRRPAMSCLFCGVTCAINADSEIITDPTAAQEKESRALMTFAIDSKEQRVMMSYTKGSFSVHELQQCIAVSQKASENIFQFYRDSVRRRYSKNL